MCSPHWNSYQMIPARNHLLESLTNSYCNRSCNFDVEKNSQTWKIYFWMSPCNCYCFAVQAWLDPRGRCSRVYQVRHVIWVKRHTNKPATSQHCHVVTSICQKLSIINWEDSAGKLLHHHNFFPKSNMYYCDFGKWIGYAFGNPWYSMN